jgi:hypothetical protein
MAKNINFIQILLHQKKNLKDWPWKKETFSRVMNAVLEGVVHGAAV